MDKSKKMPKSLPKFVNFEMEEEKRRLKEYIEKTKPVVSRPPCPIQCNNPLCKDYVKPVEMDLSEHIIVWLCGPPSCGKSTQAKRMCVKYGLSIIHGGLLLLKEIERGSMKAKCCYNIMERGQLLPSKLVVDMIFKEMKRLAPVTKGFIIDGYPRCVEQGVMFEKMICPANVIFNFEITSPAVTARHIARTTSQPKRWPTEKKTMCIATAKLQVKYFYDNLQEILKFYKKRIIEVNVEFANAETIYAVVCGHMDKLIAKREAIKRKKLRLLQEAEADINEQTS